MAKSRSQKARKKQSHVEKKEPPLEQQHGTQAYGRVRTWISKQVKRAKSAICFANVQEPPTEPFLQVEVALEPAARNCTEAITSKEKAWSDTRMVLPHSSSSAGVAPIMRKARALRYIPHIEGCRTIWQYSHNDGWKEFDRHMSQLVEDAYCSQKIATTFKVEDRTYEVNLDLLEQRLVDNASKARSVRRHYEPPSFLKSIVANVCVPLVLEAQTSSQQPLPALRGNSPAESMLDLADCYSSSLIESASNKCRTKTLPVPRWRGLDIDAYIVIAAASIAHNRAFPWHREFVFLCRPRQEEFQKELQDVLDHWPGCCQSLNASLPLQLHGGTYHWVQSCLAPQSRLERLAGACSSLREHNQHFDIISSSPVIESWEQLASATRGKPPHVCYKRGMTLVEAAMLVDPNQVAIVNAASAYHVGGGFLTGGRHALEEALCMQSDLYMSLAKAFAKVRNNRKVPYIPEDGCVVSPNVTFTRDGSKCGYQCMEKIRFKVVLSVAMPNKNPAVKDSPLDNREGKQYTVS